MRRYEVSPGCPKCGKIFHDWYKRFCYADVISGALQYECACGAFLSLKIGQFFDVSYSGEPALDDRVRVNKPLSMWATLGKRDDGSLYVGATFDSEDAAKNFRDYNPEFNIISIAEFSGTFLVDEKLLSPEKE